MPHEHSRPAVKNLEAEGFTFANQVDIFDAGPVVSCTRDEIRSVADSCRAKVATIVDALPEGETFMICTTGANFRACKGPLELDSAGVRLTREGAAALGITEGAVIRFVTLRAPGRARD